MHGWLDLESGPTPKLLLAFMAAIPLVIQKKANGKE